MFALGLMSWLYGRPIDPTIEFIEEKFREAAGDREANIKALQRRLRLRRDDRDVRGHVRGEAGEARARHVPQHHRQPGARRSGSSPRRGCPGCRSSSARTRSRPRARSSRSSPATRTSASARSRRRTRSRPRARRSARAFGGALGITTSAGPGIVLKAETVGLAIMLELPLVICDIQRAGPSTGMPTKPEQADLLMVLFGRNGESPVPVVAAALAGGLLRRRDRGVPDRAQVPHAGLPPLRRVPRERLRAVAPAGARHAARPHDDLRDRAERRATSSSRTCATPRRSRGRGRSRARRASSTGSAASRRPTARATSPTTPTTTT